MKQIFTVVLLVLIATSCKSFDNKIETMLYDCLKKTFNEQGVNLEEELSKIELYYINNGILKSSSGKAYYDFYKDIQATGEFPGSINDGVYSNITKLTPDQYYPDACFESITESNRNELTNSKFFKMTMKMQEVALTEELTQSTVANVITSVLSPSDFNIPYYKAMALLTIVNGESLVKREEINEASSQVTYIIMINSKNEIYLNHRQQVTQQVLKKELNDFVKYHKSNHLIRIFSELEASNSFYVSVLNSIEEVYTDLKNEKAKELYNKPFSELNKNEKNEIIEFYPKNLKE